MSNKWSRHLFMSYINYVWQIREHSFEYLALKASMSTAPRNNLGNFLRRLQLQIPFAAIFCYIEQISNASRKLLGFWKSDTASTLTSEEATSSDHSKYQVSIKKINVAYFLAFVAKESLPRNEIFFYFHLISLVMLFIVVPVISHFTELLPQRSLTSIARAHSSNNGEIFQTPSPLAITSIHCLCQSSLLNVSHFEQQCFLVAFHTLVTLWLDFYTRIRVQVNK